MISMINNLYFNFFEISQLKMAKIGRSQQNCAPARTVHGKISRLPGKCYQDSNGSNQLFRAKKM